MSHTNVPVLRCTGCSRTIAWLPEHAGRMVACECGFLMEVSLAPVSAASAAVPLADETTDVYSSTPPALGLTADDGAYDIAPVKPSRITRAPIPAVAIPADDESEDDDFIISKPIQARTPAFKKPQPVGYRGGKSFRDVHAEEQLADYHRTEFIYPVILIAIGLLVTFGEARLALGTFNFPLMVVYVVINTVINLVCIFAALLLAAKLMNLGLGELGPALLKIAAVAILPSAIGGIIVQSMGFGGGLLAWAVTLGLYFILLYKLFDMDVQEMSITAFIIWFMRNWVAYFVMIAILHGTGMRDDPEDDDASDESPPAVVTPDGDPPVVPEPAPADTQPSTQETTQPVE